MYLKRLNWTTFEINLRLARWACAWRRSGYDVQSSNSLSVSPEEIQNGGRRKGLPGSVQCSAAPWLVTHALYIASSPGHSTRRGHRPRPVVLRRRMESQDLSDGRRTRGCPCCSRAGQDQPIAGIIPSNIQGVRCMGNTGCRARVKTLQGAASTASCLDHHGNDPLLFLRRQSPRNKLVSHHLAQVF